MDDTMSDKEPDWDNPNSSDPRVIKHQLSARAIEQYIDAQKDPGLQAMFFYKSLVSNIEKTLSKLGSNATVAITVHLNSGQSFVAFNIGYQNPTLLLFDVLDKNNNHCSIFAHVASVQVMMSIVPEFEQPRKIGFLGDLSS